jgi:hypothetical protein
MPCASPCRLVSISSKSKTAMRAGDAALATDAGSAS